jgi:hypothetical protein
MAAKIVSQKKFAKLVSSTGVLAQPPGSLPRLSNLLLTQRGSLQIADGSKAIAAIGDAFNWEVISAFDNFQSGRFPSLVGLALGLTSAGGVTAFAATPVAGSGNPPGGYAFGIVGVTANGGHSDMAAATITILPSATFSGVNFTWTGFAGAVTYQIWMFNWPALIGGNGFSGVLIASGLTGTSFTFTGTLPLTPSVLTPVGDSTFALLIQISSIVGTSVFFNSLATSFPSFLPQASSQIPGSPGFTGALFTRIVTPYGGVSGVCDNIPQVLQFAGKSILILGNGFAPQELDPTLGSAATPTPLANTFQAAFPNWQPAVDWITGSQVTDGAGNYFVATQGGVSQTPGPPSWNIALGAETADGSVIWTSQGPIVAITAPRGAAHAVAYAGSLWLANTSPQTTSDGIDGPTCLKMSDANNPNSWNPVNTAFIGRDDGTQITGIQPFTIAALGISPTGSLCLFKEFTTYQIIGVFGSPSFEIQPAQTNLGCLAARSIQFLPGFGVVRYTHLGFAVFDGINDRLISEDIRTYLFGGVDEDADLTPVDPSWLYLARSAQTTSPPMYLCAMPLTGKIGAMTRLFCYDLVMKAWAILDLPWAITSLDWMQAAEGYPLVLAGKSDGTVQRMQSGDINWDQGAGDQSAVKWSFRTPDVFGDGGTQKIFYEEVMVKGYGSAAMLTSMTAKLWLDGQTINSLGVDIVPQGGSNVFEIRFSIFLSGYRAHLDISGNGGGASGVINTVDWAVVPKSSMARRIIS